MTEVECIFCNIRDRRTEAAIVVDEPDVLAFLDVRPVFKGHVLLVPREHHVTLMDLPAHLNAPLFAAVQKMSVAVRTALDCDGIHTANNNIISQSVAHLHVHVVPRNKKDGLRGFLWPRRKYDSDEEMYDHAARIREAWDAS